MKFLKLASFVIALGLFASCAKNDSGLNSGVAFQLKAIVSPVQGANITWTAGTASVSYVKFEAKKSDSTKIEIKSDANVQVDLFAPVNMAVVNLVAGVYKKVEFKIQLAPTSTKSALRLEGTYTAAGVSTPIVFEVGSALEIKSEKDSVTISGSTNYTAVTSFKFELLTQGVTENDLKIADRTSGKIVISPSTNAALYAKFLANLAKVQEVDFHH
ncbi:MAG: hypothetical protein JWN76_621 [Chitinophagaceae bacterium]|nr:hypothetical protein [Chitinophagaceae bacterium]